MLTGPSLVVGVARAIIADNRDPEGKGRVRISLPWHEDPTLAWWATVANPLGVGPEATQRKPTIGSEVLVAFEQGDIRFPYVLGALWNDESV